MGPFSFLDEEKVDHHKNHTPIQQFFDYQLVDHFDITKNTTFKQRFFVISDYFQGGADVPVFVVPCGGFTCRGLPEEFLFVIDLAKEFKGLVLVLEHRFYGLSQPFGADQKLTRENLKYLTVDQALADISVFITYIKYSTEIAVVGKNPFIVVGGSYSGALAAWYRAKYPYTIAGAVASSPPIEAITDFWQYDVNVHDILQEINPVCLNNVETINDYVERQLFATNDTSTFKKKFNAKKLTDYEFLYYWADTIAQIVQGGRARFLCNILTTFKTVDAQLEALRQYALEHTYPSRYAAHNLKEVEVDYEKDDGSRQWAWQICTELGWFFTAATNRSLAVRSSKLDIGFFQNWCNTTFGDDTFPFTCLSNLERGGKSIQATNLVITTACEDPWKSASLRNCQNHVDVYYIECEGCAHAVDLRAPTEDDSWSLWWTRTKIRSKISAWIDEHVESQ